MYVVERGNAKVYLLGGTVGHPEKWLSPAIRAALLQSKELWQENPATPFADNEALRTELSNRTSGSLFDDLSPAESERVLAAAKRLNIKREQLEPLRPWAAAAAFSFALFFVQNQSPVGQAEKPQPGLGDLAKEAGIPIRSELATWDDFPRFFAAMSLPAQRQYLMQTIDQVDSNTSADEVRLEEEWARGRTDGYEIRLEQMRARYPDLYLATEVQRNTRWADRIESMLTTGGVYFVNVGVNHTLGSDSIQKILEDRRIRVRRF